MTNSVLLSASHKKINFGKLPTCPEIIFIGIQLNEFTTIKHR